MADLGKRIAFVIVAAPVFLGLLWIGGWAFKAMIIAIALFIQFEILAIFRKGGYPVFLLPAVAIGLVVLLSVALPVVTPLLGLLFLWIITATVLHNDGKTAFLGIMNSIFAGLYASTGMLFLILIRDAGSDYVGLSLALTIILLVWGNDIFAYFVGKNFGRNAMVPNISPKKTWEGAAGGVVGSFFALFLCYFAIPEYPFDLAVMLPLPVIVSIAGPIGDIFASRLKRVVDVKDSSTLLPGHGGFFDRFDAMLAAMPAAFIYLYLVSVI